MSCCKCCCENRVPPGTCCNDDCCQSPSVCCGEPPNQTCCDPDQTCCDGSCCDAGEYCCNGVCQAEPCGCGWCEAPAGSDSLWPYRPFETCGHTNVPGPIGCYDLGGTIVSTPCACHANPYIRSCSELHPEDPSISTCACAQTISYCSTYAVTTCEVDGQCAETVRGFLQYDIYTYVYDQAVGGWRRLRKITNSDLNACSDLSPCPCPPAPSCTPPECPQIVSGCGGPVLNEFP